MQTALMEEARMSWGKLDDGWHRHPKVRRCSLAARGLWTTAFSWTSDMELDGFVPADMLEKLAEGEAVAPLVAELTRVAPPYAHGLWESADGGYQFHDYLELNPSARQLAKQRKGARIRMTRARSRSGEVRANERRTPGRDGSGTSYPPVPPSESDSTSSVQERTEAGAADQLRLLEGGERHVAVRVVKRGQSVATRWPADLTLTEELRAFARDGGLDPELEWAHFRDHHQAKGSRFEQWPAAFKTWCRRSKTHFGRRA